MKKFLLLPTFICLSLCAFSQDTTGGTRPNLVIPLHRAPEKMAVPQSSAGLQPDTTTRTDIPLNATDRKLRAAASSKKYRGKSKTKASVRPI